MDSSNPYFYPAIPETIHSYADSLFQCIKRNECVTTVWVPMAGRRIWNKFIIENISLFEKELPDYQRYFLVYVEPLELTEESLIGYLQLMAKSLFEIVKKNHKKIEINFQLFDLLDSKNVSYQVLLEALRSFILELASKNFRIVFFFGEFDELKFANKVFFNNLKNLWLKAYPNLQYVFLMITVSENQESIYVWDELSELILQNVIYIPLRIGADLDYLIDSFADEFKCVITDDLKNVLKQVCGGHPYSLRVGVRIIRDSFNKEEKVIRSLLLDHYELRSIATGIFDRQSLQEKQLLKSIVVGNQITQKDNVYMKYLIQLGLVREIKGNGYELFSELFTNVVLKAIGSEDRAKFTPSLSLDPVSGAILLNGATVEESFTRQEYAILALFLKNPGKLLTREAVGLELWGDLSYEKYSDWAIDQVISKLRKKLKRIGVATEIVTLRGRGYKFNFGSSVAKV
ncbi:MAG: winged helix-turn-helix domain-containing protein [Patescibacteria group bacterium]|nr:winged helix-turn-helix domain-containing protein [Patescibacteria group bacterium]